MRALDALNDERGDLIEVHDGRSNPSAVQRRAHEVGCHTRWHVVRVKEGQQETLRTVVGQQRSMSAAQ